MDVVVYILATILYGNLFYFFCLGGWFFIAGDESFAFQWKYNGASARIAIVVYYLIIIAFITAFILGTRAFF